MNCFPILYDDELFYSIIARYKRMCGITSKRALMEDLFGNNITQTSIYFPTHIENLVRNLPYLTKITANEIINKHTLYSYYTYFLTESKTQNIYNSVKKESGQVILKIGMVGNNRELNNYIKFCPICYKEDMKDFGESYWRRVHQIPGLFYCVKHECGLADSTAKAINCNLEQDYADENTCIIKDNQFYMEEKFKKLNIEFGEQVAYLLNNDIKRRELEFIIDFYIDRLRERKLASSSGHVRIKELQREFVGFFSHEYLKIMDLDIDIRKDYSWLKVFIRHNGKDRNPIKHLLFLQFLEINVKELFNCNKVVGQIKNSYKPIPNKDEGEMRTKWLKIIKENPSASRSQLKELGKGVHTWIFKHDREWYEKVSPPARKKHGEVFFVNWEEEDKECLKLSKEAVNEILRYEGKPVRICKSSIKRHLGFNTWFKNPKLVKTNEFISLVTEDTTSYRIRKIKWALIDMIEKGEKITPYKVQLYAGFGGNNKEVRPLIEKELCSIKILE